MRAAKRSIAPLAPPGVVVYNAVIIEIDSLTPQLGAA
jgi:hypothetical protein